jgi:hypothetical protein
VVTDDHRELRDNLHVLLEVVDLLLLGGVLLGPLLDEQDVVRGANERYPVGLQQLLLEVEVAAISSRVACQASRS